MEPETFIIRTVEGLRRRAEARAKALKVLDCLYWGLAGAAMYVFIGWLSGRMAFEYEHFLTPVLVSLLVGFLKASALRVDAPSMIAEVDRKFALHERLSTAYELLQGRARSALKELQVSDAALHAQKLDLKSFCTGPAIRWRLRHYILGAVFAALFLAHGAGLRYGLTELPSGTKEGSFLAEMERALPVRNPDAEKTYFRRVAGEQSFQKREGSVDEGLGGLQGSLRAENSIRLDAGERPSMFLEDRLPELPGLSDDELLRYVKGLIENRPWQLGAERYGVLKEAWERGDAAALRELLKRVSAEDGGSSSGTGSRLARGWGPRGEPRGSGAESPGKESASGENREGGGKEFASLPGLESMFEEAEGAERGRVRPGGRLPGEERGAESGAASALNEYRGGQASRVRGRLDKGEMLRGMVKTLPVRNISDVRPQEIIAQYSHEAEGIMEKYDFPPHYREYIRRYFLAIGMSHKSEDR